MIDDTKPTAKDMGLTEEFVYATRIVDMIKKVDLYKECDRNEAINVIMKAFIEYKSKITPCK